MGYSISRDVMAPLGLSAIGLARRVGVPYGIVWHAIRGKWLPAERVGHKRYLVRWPDALAFERRMSTLRLRRERVLAHFRLEHMVDGIINVIGQAKTARAAAPQAALSPAAGGAIAAQAVEYMRLLQAAGTRPERSPAPGAQPKRPRLEHRLLQQVVGWGINPDPGLAPAVRGFKRIIPVQIKVSIKRALWQKPPDHPSS